MQNFNSMILKMKLLNIESYDVPSTNYKLVKIFDKFFIRTVSIDSSHAYYDIDIKDLECLDKSEGLHNYKIKDIAYLCDSDENIVAIFSGLHFDVEVYYEGNFVYFLDIFNDLTVFDIVNNRKESFRKLKGRKLHCIYDNNNDIILGGQLF